MLYTRKPRRLISLTPLIDVVFILLIFFMISANFTQWRRLIMHSANPAASDTAESKSDSLLIKLTATHFMIEGKKIEKNAFKKQILALMIENPDLTLLLQADEQVNLQQLVHTLDQLENDGIKSVVLVQ